MLSRRQKHMIKTVKAFQEYVAFYSGQRFYQDYSDETFIHDMIYGIGIALNEKEYSWADGYEKWKERLIDTVFKRDVQRQLASQLSTQALKIEDKPPT